MTTTSDNDSGLGGQALRDDQDFLDIQSEASVPDQRAALGEIDVEGATLFLRALSTTSKKVDEQGDDLESFAWNHHSHSEAKAATYGVYLCLIR